MRSLQNVFDSFSKPAKARSETESSSLDFTQENGADLTQRALRESKIEFWLAEIKAREKAKAQELPLFFRFALKLRDATERKRLDDELRQELGRILAGAEEEERERLDPVVLEREAQERRERELLREEQERAYFESLAADQEKEIRKAQEIEQKEQRPTKDVERPSLTPEPPIGVVDVAKLVIRFPDGSRVQRRFHKDNRIQELRDFVEYCRIDFNLQAAAERFLPTYTMFVLGGPPQALTDLSQTLEQAGLHPHPTLITIKEEKH